MVLPPLTQIYKFLPIDEHWATSGQPTAAQLVAIKAAGYTVVVNLAPPDSPNALSGEAELAEALGLTYVSIPVIFDAPLEAQLAQFFYVMNANRAQGRFVHCISNLRTSAFAFLYRVIELGVPILEARQTLYQVWHLNPIWQRFIATQLAKRELEWSSELVPKTRQIKWFTFQDEVPAE